MEGVRYAKLFLKEKFIFMLGISTAPYNVYLFEKDMEEVLSATLWIEVFDPKFKCNSPCLTISKDSVEASSYPKDLV